MEVEDFDGQQPGSQGDPAGPAPAGSPTPQPQAGAPAGETPPAADPAAAGSGGRAPQGYVPIYRLNEVSQRYSRLEAAYRELAQQVQGANAKPAGSQPAGAAPSVEEQAIRDQFFKLFPAAKLILDNPELVDRLTKAADAVPQIQAQQDHYWQSHGATFLQDLRGEAKKLWGDDINPKVLRTLEMGFLDLIESDPDAQNRYLHGDRTLVADFWKEITAHMVDPIRRRAAADVQRRGEGVRRIPSPGPGTQALGKGAPPKPKDEEELHDRAWDAMQNARQ